jgi:SAM-dependent methyltransferase
MTRNVDLKQLEDEIIRLGPWHFDIDVTPQIRTSVSAGMAYPESFGQVPMGDRRAGFRGLLRSVYPPPQRLEGRSVLDCACNCGAYLFWAKELRAARCYGFDVREHWIRQAQFLLEHREGDTQGLSFEVRDLYDLPGLGLDPFDVTIFSGLFYHLPDPVRGLKIAADLTTELMLLDTNTVSGHPDGFLLVGDEDREIVMSGVHGLCWLPTGPEVLARILRWAGFVELRLYKWNRESKPGTGLGRIGMLASKIPGQLAGAAGDPI